MVCILGPVCIHLVHEQIITRPSTAPPRAEKPKGGFRDPQDLPLSAELKGAFYCVVYLHAIEHIHTTQKAVCRLILACRMVRDTVTHAI